MTAKGMLGPLIVGAVVGGIATVIVAFSAGWVVSAAEHEQDMRSARLAALSSVCVARVEEHLKETDRDWEELQGYTTDAREARDALAAQFAVPLSGKETASSDIINACAHDLNKDQS
jgi:hypothetical protein